MEPMGSLNPKDSALSTSAMPASWECLGLGSIHVDIK